MYIYTLVYKYIHSLYVKSLGVILLQAQYQIGVYVYVYVYAYTLYISFIGLFCKRDV